MSPKILPWLAAALVASCRTVAIERPISTTAEMHVGTPARAWEVLDAHSEVSGLLVFFEVRGSPQDSIYMVRNVWHQDLGLVDAYGRAFRYLPHHKEPAWIGSGTVIQGVERILEQRDCTLSEMPFDEPAQPPAPGEIDPVRHSFSGASARASESGLEP